MQLLEKAERGFVVNDAGTGLIYISEPDIPVDADFLIEEASQREKLRRILVPTPSGAQVPIVQLADRIAGRFVATVLLLAALAWRASGGRALVPVAACAYASVHHAASLAPAASSP